MKQAKVMFSQASVCPTQGGRWATRDQVTTPPSPPPEPGHNTSPPPVTRSQHLPPSPRDHIATHPPQDQVTTPPPPPGTGHNTSPPGTMRRRAVRIVLECILVCFVFVPDHHIRFRIEWVTPTRIVFYFLNSALVSSFHSLSKFSVNWGIKAS